MTPEDPIRDIMRRTIANLEFVEQHATLDGPYQTTQLLNSFLGALAHPWEAFRDDKTLLMSLPEAERSGWPAVPKELEEDSQPRNLGDLVRLLRNGIAHGHIDFFAAEDGTIQSLRVWNLDPRAGRRNWGTILEVATMRAFLFKFSELAESLCERGIERQKESA